MSNEAKNLLAPPESGDQEKNKDRKMTQAIIADNDKEAYEFLEDDDDFEEFENDEVEDYDELINQGDGHLAGEGFDRKLW